MSGDSSRENRHLPARKRAGPDHRSGDGRVGSRGSLVASGRRWYTRLGRVYPGSPAPPRPTTRFPWFPVPSCMNSRATLNFVRRERRRQRLRRARLGVLLLILAAVSIWGLLTYYEENQTFAWERSITVGVIALVDDAGTVGENDEWFIQSFLSRSAVPRHNLLEVERWIQGEYTRHTGDERGMFETFVRGPLRMDQPPPALPESDASFLTRLAGTNAFLKYFEDLTGRDDLAIGKYDVTIFVYFYDPGDRRRREVFESFDSLASRRQRFGIVFAPLSSRMLGRTCAVVAHELCHTLGASDKYTGGQSVYPGGFAEPRREPRYPQRRAEIMALGVPLAPGKDRSVRDLRECIVGLITATEMNWTRD